MKKLIVLLSLVMVLVLSSAMIASADASDQLLLPVKESETTDGVTEDDLTYLPVIEKESETEVPDDYVVSTVDYTKIANEVLLRIKSEMPADFVSKFELLIEQWNGTDHEATLGDRIKEFFEPENIVSTVGNIVAVVTLIVLFVYSKLQKASIADTNSDLKSVKNGIKANADAIVAVTQSVEILGTTVKEMQNFVVDMEAKISARGDSADTAKDVAIGVATMINHIFQNSRTIDEAGKKMMNIDYLNAIGQPIDPSMIKDDSKREEV